MPIDPRLIVYAVIIAGVGFYVWHCESAKETLAQQVAVAEEQVRQNERIAAEQKKDKETADANYRSRIATLNARVKRLRDASTSFVPPAAPGARDPSLACFDRGELERASGTLASEIQRIAQEGDEGIAALDSVKEWAAR